MSIYADALMDRVDATTLHLWQRFADLHVNAPPSPPQPAQQQQQPPSPTAASEPSPDPLTVEERDLERRSLGTLADALRAVISYAHSSYKVQISFQVKRFDRAHGQVWVKINPDEVPEGFDLKYLLQHIKFFENIPRYAELLGMDDYRLRSTCQYFLDLQSKAASPKSDDPLTELLRVKETMSRAAKLVQDMINVGITDRDVIRQLAASQTRLQELKSAAEKLAIFQQNRSQLLHLSGTWYPEKRQLAAKSIHQQMQPLLDDPEVCKYILHVVAPRLGIVPFQFTPPSPGPLIT